MKRKLNSGHALPSAQEDKFMSVFKYYKSNSPKPSYDKVISIPRNTGTDELVRIPPRALDDARADLLGLCKLSKWEQYTFKKHPGLILIKNPFTTLGHRYWIRQCLEVYPRKPNKRNIDTDADLDVDDWWEECYESGEIDRKFQTKLRWTTLGYHHDWDTKVKY